MRVRQLRPRFPQSLVQAAADARAQRFHEAELALRQALSSDPENAALHFALGTMLRQQERWDDAFDEITRRRATHARFPREPQQPGLHFLSPR